MPDHEEILERWPEKSREACERVVNKYGPPDEVTETRMTWHGNGPWKRTEVNREPIRHNWPMEHHDMVAMVIDYHVPPGMVGPLARFDGSVVVDRTKGELSARCEAEEANFLALNLAHEIVTGKRNVVSARQTYAENMQRKQHEGLGPYMKRLLFTPPKGDTKYPDETTLKDDGTRIRDEKEVLQATPR
jgi:hypothetical protein